MDKYKIIEEVYKLGWIRGMSKYYTSDISLLDDFDQEIYMILLRYKDETIISAWEKNELKYLISRIMQNQWKSTTSPFYCKYRKRAKNEINIDDYEGEI